MADTSPFTMLPCLEHDLRRVEDELLAAAAAADDFVTELARHLIAVGGKLVRPGFCLASSLVCDPAPESSSQAAVKGGASVELVHIGSLYHDDVMDGATTRRSVPSVNAQWGNLRAILAGDYLLGRASALAASLGAEVAMLLAEAITQLCEGQIIELENAYDTERSEQRYERAISGKTAALLSISCRIGATVGEVPRPVTRALGEFGFAYGMAFQIVDDILDLVATESQLGKPTGNDLAEGTYTLPVIRALADPVTGDELRSLLGQPIDAAARDRAAELVRSTTGVDEARGTARIWAGRAQAALTSLPDTPATSVLRLAADRLTETPALAG
ncbi:MAG: polyprenyl synthetase family protein [Acidimicrobiaceae bacterium]|nr:polyprenyl synthetase family protein [Acidimicrobiaceae bacterium]MDE0493822.1 polyprenyl synthetase family protein [Acidimicrobiaceae bacterium]MXY10538.1 polyprenyl synthetase family protein [Acidimicrobiaceae bacterium]MXZ64854.1 polyprenyl synthetase family protein [Acidimicrobiaceae bacterium]MYE55515.1 polyprenyl synthetase family protein [Acidimicrobiaceae bacterium]